MSLRGRLAAAVLAALVVTLVCGSIAGYFQGRRQVNTELAAARSVAVNAVTRLIAELPASRDPQQDLETLARSFNGNRHVRILAIDAFGAVRMQSTLAPAEFAPAAFAGLLAPVETSTIVPMPAKAAPVVAAMVVVMPGSEIAEVWNDLVLDLLLLLVFVALALGLLAVVLDRTLRPLGALTSAFHRIGGGDYAYRLDVRGPPELAALAHSCNRMTERLAAMARRNQRLSEQLLRLQDEERADLARDLHDDVGPFLFAIDVDAATVAGLADPSAEDRRAEIQERATAIREATRHARVQVRRILGALRPGLLPGLGLAAALEHLVAACRSRHPEIAFELCVHEGDYGMAAEALVHRAVREAVNNALRHGKPKRIAIRVGIDGERVAFRIVDDGGGWSRSDPETGGYGLISMRERVEALGGRLVLSEIGLPAGIAVFGEVPWPAAAGAADGDASAVPDDDRMPALGTPAAKQAA